ncbi:MAG: ABC transporter ATP-binding protein [Gemmatimonadales bacterium]|nr:ABC transporter ATP-binding protein [Gemmatimonadota bacterium]MDX2057516.1 ABC transporter ATP-binding protein [Gemmatimonadales bacterium]
MTALVARDVSVRYPGAGALAVEGVSLAVVPGRLVAVVGPNGGGKTSLLRALLGAIEPERGQVLLEDRPIRTWPARDRAREIGFVAQREEYPFAWRVAEVVGFGRYARLPALAALGAADHAAIDRALERADVRAFRDRRIDTLSGGEWQRVRIARALAQEPKVLLLDEPTAALDIGHEMEIFELIRQLTDDGLASVVVTHDLNLAARFADTMVLMARGRTVAEGPPATVLEPRRLSGVFGWPLELAPIDGSPQVVALRQPRAAPGGS